MQRRHFLIVSLCVLVFLGSHTGIAPFGVPASRAAQSGDAASRRVLSAEEIARAYMPGVVTIVCENSEGKSLGSGFVVRSGVVVTNLHVIALMHRGGVFLSGETRSDDPKWWVTEVLAVDEDADLALLAVPEATRLPVIPLASNTRTPTVGQKVFALGSPKGLEGTISEGIISSGLRKEGNVALIQISAPISHGSSGGPVVNNRGEAVGVAFGSFSQGQNLNFAIPAFKVVELLGRLNAPRREKAEPVGLMPHAWKATLPVARAMKVALSTDSPFTASNNETVAGGPSSMQDAGGGPPSTSPAVATPTKPSAGGVSIRQSTGSSMEEASAGAGAAKAGGGESKPSPKPSPKPTPPDPIASMDGDALEISNSTLGESDVSPLNDIRAIVANEDLTQYFGGFGFLSDVRLTDVKQCWNVWYIGVSDPKTKARIPSCNPKFALYFYADETQAAQIQEFKRKYPGQDVDVSFTIDRHPLGYEYGAAGRVTAISWRNTQGKVVVSVQL